MSENIYIVPPNQSNQLNSSDSDSLSGDVTGPQSNTAISSSTVTGKLLTGLSVTGSTVVATDSILTAFGKLQNSIGSSSVLTTLSGYSGLINWYDVSQMTAQTNMTSFASSASIPDLVGSIPLVMTGGNGRYQNPGQGGKQTISTLSGYLESASSTLHTGPFTMFFAYNTSGANQSGYASVFTYGSSTNATAAFVGLLLIGGSGATNVNKISVVNASSWNDTTGLGSGSGNVVNGDFQYTTGGQLSVITYDGMNAGYRQNGIQGNGGQLGSTWTSTGKIWVGNNNYSQVAGLEFCELAIFNRVLGMSEIAAIESYLKAKWSTP